MSRAISLMLQELRRDGVVVSIDRGDLVVRGPKHSVSPGTLAELRNNKSAIVSFVQSGVESPETAPVPIAGLGGGKMTRDCVETTPKPSTQPTEPSEDDLGPSWASEEMPSEGHRRATWLGRVARLAGYDAEALFDLIDRAIGPRTIGPYALSAAESATVADILRTEIGKRPAIASLTTPSTMVDTPATPRSIVRKNDLGWSDDQFARFCERLLGHPGLREKDNDSRVLTAMPRVRP